jgi:hypothetical protein
MGRKVSIGIVGSGGGLGTIVASGTGNTLTTAVTNQNLIIDPNGTGITQIVGATQLNAQSELRLADADSSNYIALKAAGTISSNYTITWPAAVAASNGYVLTSQTDGTLAWSVIPATGVTAADSGSVATVHYPLFETSAGAIPTGSLTTAKVRANLSFVPSTGELTATAYLGANVYGSAANSGTLTLRGTTSATKATASVLMTDGVASTTTGTGTLVVTGGIGATGQVTCGTLSATTITETSSIALKENVTALANPLDVVLNLFGVEYDRKDTKQHEIGLIAEDVYKIAPDLVSLDEDGNPHGVKYTKVGAYLIEAIKILNQKIKELESKH